MHCADRPHPRAGREQLADAGQPHGLVAAERLVEQAGLRAERVVDAGRVQASGPLDVGHRGGFVPALAEHADRVVEHLIDVEGAGPPGERVVVAEAAMASLVTSRNMDLKGPIQNSSEIS